jgi:predicted GIY-YIG superfamily endonuclease
VSGLYFVVAHTPEPQLVYIGKAKNFSQRWKSHHRQPEINLLEKLGLAVDIHWLELRVSNEVLIQWENQLIKDLSPALNDTLTMAVEVDRLENKVARLEEFVIKSEKELIALPDLALIPTSFEYSDKDEGVKGAEIKLPSEQWNGVSPIPSSYIATLTQCIRQGLSKNKVLELLNIKKGGSQKYQLISQRYDELKQHIL